ncbi:MAG: hypothetical protein ACFFAN_17945 [Promethearchaeota archaeon]
MEDFQNDFEIPEHLYNNLIPNEKILHKFRAYKPSKIYRILILLFIGGIITMIITNIITVVRKGIDVLFSLYLLLIYLIYLPFMFIFFLIMRKRLNFKRDYYIIITNKRIYIHESANQREYINSIELNSIKLITFRYSKHTEKFGVIGAIDLVSDEIKNERKNRISIRGIQNLLKNLNIIESIMWDYGNIKERLDFINKKSNITLPHDFKLDKILWKKINRSSKILSIRIIISIILIVIGLIGIIYDLINNKDVTIYGFIFICILSIGLTEIVFSPRRKYSLSKIISSKKDITLRLKENEIVLIEGQSSLSFPFNLNFYINIYNTYYSFKTGSKKIIGGIKIKSAYENLVKIKFGPIEDYLKVAEKIYLYILNWKAKKGFLKSKEIITQSKEISKEDLPIRESQLKTDKEEIKISFSPLTIALLIIFIVYTGLYIAFFTINLVLHLSFDIFDILIISGFLITIFVIYKKKKYGFILAIIISAILTVLRLLILAFIDIVFLGSILVLAILEYRNYAMNYQLPIEHSSYQELSVQMIEPFLKYCNPDEEILLSFKPQISIQNYILMIIVGFLSLILLFFMLSFIIMFFIILFVIVFLLALLGVAVGMTMLCMLPSILLMKKSNFIFTNQKLIANYGKDYLMIPYINIKSIKPIKKRTYYDVEISLIHDLDSNPFTDKSLIYIEHVPINSDILEKITTIRNNALTVNNDNQRVE